MASDILNKQVIGKVCEEFGDTLTGILNYDFYVVWYNFRMNSDTVVLTTCLSDEDGGQIEVDFNYNTATNTVSVYGSKSNRVRFAANGESMLAASLLRLLDVIDKNTYVIVENLKFWTFCRDLTVTYDELLDTDNEDVYYNITLGYDTRSAASIYGYKSDLDFDKFINQLNMERELLGNLT